MKKLSHIVTQKLITLSHPSEDVMPLLDKEFLEGQPRKELQRIAKEYGLKANKSNEILIKNIIEACITDEIQDEQENETKEQSVESEIVTATAEPEQILNETKKRRITMDDTEPAASTLLFKDWKTGDEVCVDGVHGVILRLNKKSARVQRHDTKKEITAKFEDISSFLPSTQTEQCVEEQEKTEDLKTKIEMLVPLGMSIDDDDDVIVLKSPIPAKTSDISQNGPFSYSIQLANIIASTKSMFSPVTSDTPHKLAGTPATCKASHKKLAATPSSLRRPSIAPSTTKSQVLRHEASLVKKRNFDEIQKQAQQEVDDFLLSSSISKPRTAPMSGRKPSSNVSVRPAKSAPTLRKSVGKPEQNYKSKPVPDFNGQHAKQFSKQKSITNIVPRVIMLFFHELLFLRIPFVSLGC